MTKAAASRSKDSEISRLAAFLGEPLRGQGVPVGDQPRVPRIQSAFDQHLSTTRWRPVQTLPGDGVRDKPIEPRCCFSLKQ